MPVSRKPERSDPAQQPQQPAGNVRHVLGIKDTSQLPTKRTINLCMREKDGMSAEVFLLILSLILIVMIIVEFAGVYTPYKKVEALEADVSEQQAEVDRKETILSDYAAVRKEFLKYNYEGFDLTIADRLDILAILDREVIGKAHGTISAFSVEGKTLRLTVVGLDKEAIAALDKALEQDPLVKSALHTRTSYDANGVPTAQLTITFNDADTVEKTEEVQP